MRILSSGVFLLVLGLCASFQLSLVRGTEITLASLLPYEIYPDSVLYPYVMDLAAKAVLAETDFINQTNITDINFIHQDSLGNTMEVVRKAINITQHEPSLVGFVGEVTSVVTESLACYASAIQIPICGGTASSPDFRVKNVYQYFFRTNPAASLRGVAIADYVYSRGWRRIAILASADSFGQGWATSASQRSGELGIEVLLDQSYLITETNFTDFFTEVKLRDIRIIMLVGYPSTYSTILQTAFDMDMLNSDYVYVVAKGYVLVPQLFPNQTYLLRGLVLVEGVDYRPGPEYDAFFQQWTNYWQNKTPGEPIPSLNHDTGYYHDCVVSLLKGLQKFLVANNMTVDQFLSSPLRQNLTYEQFNMPEVIGVTGRLGLDSVGDRIGPIGFYNFQNSSMPVLTTVWNRGNLSEVAPFYFWNWTTTIPPDHGPGKPEFYVPFSSAMGIAITILTCLLLLLCLLIFGSLIYFRENLVIKSSSLPFCLLMTLGCTLGALSVFTEFDKPTKVNCMASAWLFAISFGLIYANLVGKTYRIYRIFNNDNLRVIHLDNKELFAYNSIVLLIEIVLLIVWTAYDPLVPVADTTSDSHYTLLICHSKRQGFETAMIWILIGINLGICFAGAIMGIRTRHVESNYKESKYIGFAIYNIFILAVIVLPICFVSGTSPQVKFLVLTLGILVASGMSLLILFVPKFLLVFVKQRGRSGSSGSHGQNRSPNHPPSHENDRKKSLEGGRSHSQNADQPHPDASNPHLEEAMCELQNIPETI